MNGVRRARRSGVYTRWWIDVKATWKLTITLKERTALGSMLDTCP